jgi:hypothetical protein
MIPARFLKDFRLFCPLVYDSNHLAANAAVRTAPGFHMPAGKQYFLPPKTILTAKPLITAEISLTFT